MLCILFAFIMLGMLALAVSGKSRFPLVNKAVAFIVLPMENGLTALGHTSDGIRGYWRALTVLQSENEELKRSNDELRYANIHMASIYAENQQLRSLLNYKEQHRSQTVVAGKIIARNYGDLRDSVYIDIGADKGLKVNQAVVNGGLIGVIDEVYDDYARVLLITSAKCRVGARVLRPDSRAVGVIGGHSTSSGQLILEHIYREASLKEGDIIITSGYSGNHPGDIMIGTVKEIRMDSVGLLQQAKVIPAADIADVEHVLVITGFTPEPKINLDMQGGRVQ